MHVFIAVITLIIIMIVGSVSFSAGMWYQDNIVDDGIL